MTTRNCSTCKFAGWDPDGNYCVAPKVMEKNPYGLYIGTIPNGVKGCASEENFPLYEKQEKQ